MSNYIITEYCYDKAIKLNLILKVSKNPLKKLDVYNIFIASIGDSNYMDYPYDIITYNLEYTNKRKQLYFRRPKKYAAEKYSKYWLVLNLLW